MKINEKELLKELEEAYAAGYLYIARDKDYVCYVYRNEPEKLLNEWATTGSCEAIRVLYHHCFSVLWSDSSPTEIKELIAAIEQHEYKEVSLNYEETRWFLEELKKDDVDYIFTSPGNILHGMHIPSWKSTSLGRLQLPFSDIFETYTSYYVVALQQLLGTPPKVEDAPAVPSANHDSFYQKLGVEPWDIMKSDFTHEEFKGFLKGNILKYLLRNKEGVKDYEKLANYAKQLVDWEKSKGEGSNLKQGIWFGCKSTVDVVGYTESL